MSPINLELFQRIKVKKILVSPLELLKIFLADLEQTTLSEGISLLIKEKFSIKESFQMDQVLEDKHLLIYNNSLLLIVKATACKFIIKLYLQKMSKTQAICIYQDL
jgi:hypothetical protein